MILFEFVTWGCSSFRVGSGQQRNAGVPNVVSVQVVMIAKMFSRDLPDLLVPNVVSVQVVMTANMFSRDHSDVLRFFFLHVYVNNRCTGQADNTICCCVFQYSDFMVFCPHSREPTQ